MPKIPTSEDLIKQNPKISAKQLAELDSLAKKLRELGVIVEAPKLPSPVTRKRIVTGEKDRPDPRTIHLSKRR